MTIPAGVEDGNQPAVRERGRGRRASGDSLRGSACAPRGLRPARPDLLYELPTFPQAALGAEIEVPVLGGKSTVTVPAGTQPGQQLRLRGKGMPQLRGRGHGDAVYQVAIEVPTRLTSRQRELL